MGWYGIVSSSPLVSYVVGDKPGSIGDLPGGGDWGAPVVFPSSGKRPLLTVSRAATDLGRVCRVCEPKPFKKHSIASREDIVSYFGEYVEF